MNFRFRPHIGYFPHQLGNVFAGGEGYGRQYGVGSGINFAANVNQVCHLSRAPLLEFEGGIHGLSGRFVWRRHLPFAAAHVAAVTDRINVKRLRIIAMLVASGAIAAINADRGRGYGRQEAIAHGCSNKYCRSITKADFIRGSEFFTLRPPPSPSGFQREAKALRSQNSGLCPYPRGLAPQLVPMQHTERVIAGCRQIAISLATNIHSGGLPLQSFRRRPEDVRPQVVARCLALGCFLKRKAPRRRDAARLPVIDVLGQKAQGGRQRSNVSGMVDGALQGFVHGLLEHGVYVLSTPSSRVEQRPIPVQE